MSRKCSLCREVKPETEFRFMGHLNRYNSYCKECERWYNRLYMRAYRERKQIKEGAENGSESRNRKVDRNA